eukprot:gnl/MRDRNA2_/MRDRNA2_32622_c0_seq1.p1 gnl/MRDRNA2_/MRDRNA2_32622_c0~~gnl/MRDRNA2_/MRDRNA2_32622_c0_seq1.p1  ORF type:complete len:780 (-),score=187.44 gnl/MRDRNA2_/MRDRNA2_32622_c0_seq1:59-2353(-)
MAQTFVGSNNINLLVPSGQFGTRLQGGKDAASARYIYTRLSHLSRLVFHPDDDNVLKYLRDEGISIEPYWYCPIIPMVLVNGVDGIGTGWSSQIPNYNPREIIKNIRKHLQNKPMDEMHPWYKGFRGSITPNEKEDKRSYDVHGCIEQKSQATIEITELPIRKWTQDYKEWLQEQLPQTKGNDDESAHLIEDIKEHHTEARVHFELKLTPDKMNRAVREGLEKSFKLKSSLAVSNMMLFDHEGKIKKYETSLDIIQDFCKLRLEMYAKRKAYLMNKLGQEKEILNNKVRFILMVVQGELELRKRKKKDLLAELREKRFKTLDEIMKTGDTMRDPEDELPEEENTEEQNEDPLEPAAQEKKSGYDYLLSMPLWSLTLERVEELKKLLQKKTAELDELTRTTIQQLWTKDLDALEGGLDEQDRMDFEDQQAEANMRTQRKQKGPSRRKPPPGGPSGFGGSAGKFGGTLKSSTTQSSFGGGALKSSTMQSFGSEGPNSSISQVSAPRSQSQPRLASLWTGAQRSSLGGLSPAAKPRCASPGNSKGRGKCKGKRKKDTDTSIADTVRQTVASATAPPAEEGPASGAGLLQRLLAVKGTANGFQQPLQPSSQPSSIPTPARTDTAPPKKRSRVLSIDDEDAAPLSRLRMDSGRGVPGSKGSQCQQPLSNFLVSGSVTNLSNSSSSSISAPAVVALDAEDLQPEAPHQTSGFGGFARMMSRAQVPSASFPNSSEPRGGAGPGSDGSRRGRRLVLGGSKKIIGISDDDSEM